MKKLAIFLATALSVVAVVPQASAALTDTVAVSSVSVGGSGDVFIRTDGTFVPTSGCTNTSRYLLPTSHGAKKELLAILLTAQASGQNVRLSTAAGCATIGANTYTQVVNIEVVGS